MVVGFLGVMALAYFIGILERQRLGTLRLSVGAAATVFDDEADDEGLPSMSDESAELRRPKLFWLNPCLTVGLMAGLVTEVLPLSILFMVAFSDQLTAHAGSTLSNFCPRADGPESDRDLPRGQHPGRHPVRNRHGQCDASKLPANAARDLGPIHGSDHCGGEYSGHLLHVQ